MKSKDLTKIGSIISFLDIIDDLFLVHKKFKPPLKIMPKEFKIIMKRSKSINLEMKLAQRSIFMKNKIQPPEKCLKFTRIQIELDLRLHGKHKTM